MSFLDLLQMNSSNYDARTKVVMMLVGSRRRIEAVRYILVIRAKSIFEAQFQMELDHVGLKLPVIPLRVDLTENSKRIIFGKTEKQFSKMFTKLFQR